MIMKTTAMVTAREPDAEMARQSAAMQRTLLRGCEYSPEAFWRLQDRLIAWRIACVMGWLTVLVLVWIARG